MDIKKIVLATVIIAAVGSAGTVLDGVSGLGLGTNPAFPAVWKSEKRVDAGFNLVSSTDTYKKNVIASQSVKDISSGLGSPWASYTDKFGDYFYSLGFASGVGSVNGTKTTVYADKTKKTNLRSITETSEDAGSNFSLAVAREFKDYGITGGISLGLNTDYTKNVTSTKPTGGKTQELIESTKSDTYLTVALGAVKELDPQSKVLIGQTLGVEKKVNRLDDEANKYWKDVNGDPAKKLGSHNDFTPAETALGYVYKVNADLEVAGTYVRNWGGKLDYRAWDDKGEETGDAALDYHGYNAFGFAVDYVYSEFEVQGYANFASGSDIVVNTDAAEFSDWSKRAQKGKDTTTLGVNLLWTPSFADIGTVGLLLSTEKAVQNGQTETTGTTAVAYTYLF